MNERIQQMIYSLNEKEGVHWTNEDKLKFAELIVGECANHIMNSSDRYRREYFAEMILKHFGVEE